MAEDWKRGRGKDGFDEADEIGLFSLAVSPNLGDGQGTRGLGEIPSGTCNGSGYRLGLAAGNGLSTVLGSAE